MSPPLTVIVPVFNEQATIDTLLQRVLAAPYPDKQVVVVDDGSTDDTASMLRRWQATSGVLVLRHATNVGKGAAVRTALAHAIGEVTLVQDADLEYDPEDYTALVEPILAGECPVIYGSRYLTSAGLPWSQFRLAVVGLNFLVRLLYGVRLTDEATCYKVASTRHWRALALEANGFELCAEFTAKSCRLHLPIREVAVRFTPRSVADGKKIGWLDIWPTLWTLFRWRFKPMRAIRDAVLQRSAREPSCLGSFKFLPELSQAGRQRSDARIDREKLQLHNGKKGE
jgi:glycosyltransferase involved in cell wall biosynthesis